MRYLSEHEVIQINTLLIRRDAYKEMIGVKEANLLNSAVQRPQQSAFGQDAYPTIYEKAAALFQSLAQNHPFYNANKRTAFVSMAVFLALNGIKFNAPDHEVIHFTIRLSDRENGLEIRDVSRWIKCYAQKK
ncbi:MAG: type II toxin-antitoxin system death-on-curing family toxin [Sporolactobacillus sp.]|jgi:death-on-curing protein|nr:type II toxin-antitoxin system death-on-curing family toxin [Sporolactobacillus sp.]